MKSAILPPVIVVAVVAAAVGVMVVMGTNPFQKPTGGVVESGITKLLDAKTFKVNGRLEAEIKAAGDSLLEEGTAGLPPAISSTSAFLDVSASIDHSKKEALKTSSGVTIGVDTEGIQINAALELITINSNIYVKLVSLPPAFLPFLGGADIKNQWITIDIKGLMEQYQQAGVEFDTEQIEKQLEALTKSIKDFLADKTVFDIKQELGQEEINGVAAEHYSVSANKQAVKEFIPKYLEMLKEYLPEEQQEEYEKSFQEAMNDFSANFDQFWATLGGVSFDVWVEKRGGRLVRINWQKDIDTSRLADMPEGIGSVTIKADFVFSEFNEKTNIEAPGQAKPFEDILSSLMSSFIPQGLSTSSMQGLPSGPSGF